jgi:hypothetical protein
MEKQEPRKLRKGLTPAEQKKAERIGCLEYRSHRNPFKYRAHETFKFIPSREQH